MPLSPGNAALRCLLNHGERCERLAAAHNRRYSGQQENGHRAAVHELSIIQEVVAAAAQAAAEEGATRVEVVTLRVGALAGVVKESLLFCYDVASAGTVLAGSRLEIEELPVVIHCAVCQADRSLLGIQSFRCPVCGTPSADLRQGRELELIRMEVEAA